MSKDKPKRHFFKHEEMDYQIQIMLGSCYYGACDTGEVIAAADKIKDSDPESWYQIWHTAGERIEKIAHGCAKAGNDLSARETFLRAANYYAASMSMLDGTDDPSRGVPAWEEHIACFKEFCRRLTPPADIVRIPYKDAPMPGYFFTPDDSGGPWATIIFNNGSDGPTACMWQSGIAAALRRGYAALTFDGPGQNELLWLHGVPFRYDWEKVVTPVVDYLTGRGDVRSDRIALSGISQGGYWALRALAFEKRIAAGIVDPGVMDVSTVMLSKLPKSMAGLLEEGNEEKFNKEMGMALKMMGHAARQSIAWRMKPYGTDSYYRWAKMSIDFNARDIIDKIGCPMFIADPEDEQFWPGQSREVFDALKCPKTIVRFTADEGANWHCEPRARALYDQRMFDWLTTVMPAD